MNQTFHGLRLEAVACVVPLYDTTLGAYAERFGKDIAERYHKVVGIQRTPFHPATTHSLDQTLILRFQPWDKQWMPQMTFLTFFATMRR